MLQFIVCVTVFPILMGLGFIQLKKEKGTESLTECYVLGLLFLFLLGEAASCIVIKMDGSFSFYCLLFACFIGAGALISLVIGRKVPVQLWENLKNAAGEKRDEGKRLWNLMMALVGVLLLLAFPILGYWLYVPDAAGSTMVETISVTVLTDTIFGYNPVTGAALEYGMYPIHKFACLPLIYSALYRLSGLSQNAFAYYAIPIWVLLVFVMLMAQCGKTVFGENKEKRSIFMLLLGAWLVTGNGDKGTLAYQLLHGGFKGETLACAVIIPFGVYMLYYFFVKKERLFGGIGTMLSLCGILVSRPLFLPERFAFFAEDSGREWMLFALAVFVLYLTREKTRKKWKKQEVVLLGMCLFAGLITGNIFPMAGTAYVGTCLWNIAEERKKAVPFLVGAILLICMAGTVLPFRGDCTKKADIPSGDVEILNRIEELAEDCEKEAVLVAPQNVMERARLHNTKIVLPYGKDLWQENCNREIADVYTDKEILLFEQMKTDYMQPDTIAVMAAEMHCNILVMRERMSEEVLIRGGWKEADDVTGYAVYYK